MGSLQNDCPIVKAGWQKLREGTNGLRQKVWTQTKILSPNIRYFVAILRFVAIYALFGNLWAKKSLTQNKTFLTQSLPKSV